MEERVKSPDELAFFENLQRPLTSLQYWWDTAEINFLKSVLTPESIFVDVGAHMGTYTWSLAPYVKEIHAFEPGRIAFGALLFVLERAHYDNVITYQMALSYRSGLCEYHATEVATLGSLGNPLQPVVESYPVLTTTLDWVLATRMIARCDAIKIDTNGAETLVVAGGQKFFDAFRPLVVSKIDAKKDYGFGCQPTDIFRLLSHYNWYRIDQDGKLIAVRNNDTVPQHFNVIGVPEEHVSVV